MWITQIVGKGNAGDVLDRIQQAIEDVVAKAETEFNQDYQGEYPEDGIGISTLRPFHVEDATPTLPDAGRNNWLIAIAAATTWQDWFNLTTSDRVYLLVTGIFNRTAIPSATEVWFKASGRDLPAQNIEKLYTFEEPYGYWSKPFWIGPEKRFQGQVYGRVAQNEWLGLDGFAVGKADLLFTTS